MKICSKCKIEKELDCFSKDKQKADGLRLHCKQCIKEQSVLYRTNNAKKIKETNIKYREKSKEKIKAYAKEYRFSHQEYEKKRHQEYQLEHRKEKTIYVRCWRQKNKILLNKSKKIKYHADPLYRLSYTLRKVPNRLINIFKNKGLVLSKKDLGHLENYLGCSLKIFISYLESLFLYGMNWNNYGNKEGQWSIDHKIPLALGTTIERALELSYYTNLQPMWHTDNVKKKAQLDYQPYENVLERNPEAVTR